AYESTLMVGHGDTQTNARLLVQDSEVFLESNDPQIEVSGREGTHIQLIRGSLQIVSEPDATAMADGEWVSGSLILGSEGGYGRLQADGSIRQDEYGTELLRADDSRWGNDILVQGAHASVELGIGGGDSYGLAYIDWGTQLVVDASADATVYDSELPDVPDSPFAFINIGGKPWADGSPGDQHGGEGALVIRGGEVFLKTDATQLDGSSVVNVGSAGGTGLLQIENGSLTADRIIVGSGVDYGPSSPAGYGVLDVRYNGEVYADSITVGDLTGLATGQHAFFLSDSDSDDDLSVGIVDITTGGVLLGHSFTLDTTLTIGVGGALMVGDDYEYAHTNTDTSWSNPSARGEVIADAGYFRNEGYTTIQGDVIMQFEGREADFSDSDVIKNADGASIAIGSTARFNLSLSADNSYFVAGGFAANDPALVGSQTWGRARVIQQEGTSGNVSIDDGAQVLINGVDGDLWEDDSGHVWAYFDLGQVFPERDYWVVEGSDGLPISVALEKPDVYDNIDTIYSESYASYNQVFISSEFSDTWGTAGDDVIRPGENGDRTVTIHSGGGNDFIYADNAYANLGLQDRDELDLSDITDGLVWDTQYGSVTNGTWTTLFVGLESLVGGKGNDSYNLSGLKALSIADFEGNNQYVLSESVTNIGQLNWEIAYDKEGMQAPETPLYIKAVAASDGSLDVQRLAISGDTLLGTDQVSGVALFVGSDGDDTWNFDGYIANAYTGTYGVPWQILSVASGDDVVVGNGFTRVEFGRTDTDFSGLTFNAASATLNEDGLFVYSVATDTGTKQLVNVDAIGGTSGDDTFLGSSRDELFVDYGGNDQISGGFGVDVADYRNVDHYINVYLRDEVDGSQSSVNGSSAGSDNLSGVEMVRGTAGNDYFSAHNFRTVDEFGNESTFNAFRGRGGDDRVYGNGNTRVEYVDSLVAVHVDLQSNYSDARYASDLGADAYVSSLGKDEIYNVNAVSGSAYDDWLVGSSAEMEFFEGRAGDDLIDGGGGVWNQVRYDFDTGGVTVNLGTGVAFDGWGGTDTLIDIDGVTGSAFDDLLIGSDSDYQQGFQGGAGNDTILAEGGYDEVMFINAKAGVNVDLSSVQTTKTVAGVDYSGITIADGSGGTDFVSGVEGIEGSGFNDTLTGSDGNNRIDGRGGSDTLDGGDGVDWVEYNNDAGGVFVSLADGVAIQGMDSASYFSTYTNTNGVYDAAVSIGGRDKDTLSGFENIQGSQGNDVLIGDGGDNRFVTVGGTDYVVGGAGIDKLIVNGTYDSSWLQADALVEGRFIHYEDGNRKTVIE
ncbi:hypothetical protein N9D59_08020, partial [Burkholderiaceae bacterium]|nr:hypothetical protein [Burkholderiaceae bacterium]